MNLAATMTFLMIGLTTAGETWGQESQKGKPGGGGGDGSEPNWVIQLTIHDNHPGAQRLGGGGSCACAKLAYLTDPDGSPAAMYGGEPARTSLVDSDPGDPLSGTCTLGLGAGAIVWPDGSGNLLSESAIPRIEAWPFEDLHDSQRSRRRAGQSIDERTDVRLDFHTDIKNLGDQDRWELNSQGEIVPTTSTGNDEREIAASGQKFDLTGPDHLFPSGGQCSNVSMTFKLTVKRIDVNAGQ